MASRLTLSLAERILGVGDANLTKGTIRVAATARKANAVGRALGFIAEFA